MYESGDIRVNYHDVASLGGNQTGAGIENANGTVGLEYTPLRVKGRYRDFYVHYSYPDENQAPVADAGSDQNNVNVGETITLDGSDSYDPDSGDTISYEWTQVGDGPEVTLLNSTTAHPSFIVPDMGPDGGTLLFELVVSDKKGLESGADSVAVRVKNTVVSSTTPQSGLYFPHIITAGDWETEICLINTDGTTSMKGDLKAYNGTGNNVATKSVTLAPYGRQQFTVSSLFDDSDQIGYIVLEESSGAAVGYVKYFVDEQYRAAVPAVSADDISTGNIYIPRIVSGDGWSTEINMINATVTDKEITLNFDNGETQTISLVSGESRAVTIKSLFGGDPQPGIHSAVIAGGGGVLAIETIERENWLCGILLKDDLATSIYYPHIVDGSLWKTGLVAYNPNAASCTVDIIPYDTWGNQLSATPQQVSVNGESSFVMHVGGVDEVVTLPEETAWLTMESSSGITGFNLFATENSYAGFSTIGTKGRGGILPKLVDPELGGAEHTGIVLLNIEDESAAVDVTAYSDSGDEIASTTVTIPGHANEVTMAKALFPGQTINGASYVRYSSDRDLVGFQMNLNTSKRGMGMMLDGLPALRTKPFAFIDAPGDGNVFSRDEIIDFEGRGYDAGGTQIHTLMFYKYPYKWTSDIDGQIGYEASFSTRGMTVGTHTITLTVEDNGEVGADQVNIEIVGSANNQQPYAVIESPAQGSENYAVGDTVDLAGSAGDYEDGDLTGDSLVWTYTVDGGASVEVEKTGASSWFEAASAGDYVITLTATDGDGATATDTVSITVYETHQSVPPEAYIDSVLPVEGTNLYAGQAIVFDGHAVEYSSGTEHIVDKHSFLVGFTWKVDGTEVGKGNPLTLANGLKAGFHKVTLTVTVSQDGNLVTATSAEKTINVND